MSNGDAATAGGSKKRWILLGAGGVGAAAALAFFVWFVQCPCERTPGSYLRGTVVETAQNDWRFANAVPLCQIEVRAFPLRHSLNLNCMAVASGDLYLSCAGCEGKRWSTAALADGRARLRLGEDVYPVQLTRVTDPDELDLAFAARAAKRSGDPPPAPPVQVDRSEGWWSFKVESR